MTDSPTNIPRKDELRAVLQARLKALDQQERDAAAKQLRPRVLDLPEVRNARTVLSCLSFGSEIDTWALIASLREQGKNVLVPRAEPRDKSLHLHPYPCPLRTLGFGLQQPPRGTAEIEIDSIDDTVDVVLVLGLGFDRRGYRLGYGSGYFDRFLAGRRPFPAVALAYDCQLIDSMPEEPHDVPLQVVATDQRVLRPL